MNIPATLLLVGMLFAGRPHVGRPAAAEVQWIVTKHSSLNIAGKTNISPFSCTVAQYAETDTLTFLPEEAPSENVDIPLQGTLNIPIGSFDCHNRFMTADLRNTLKSDRYPQLKIRFISLDRMPAFRTVEDQVKGWVEIGLAGVNRQFRIDYRARRIDSTDIQLTGCRELNFTDFGLEPPRKMGGLIKVDNALQVQFILCLQRN